MGVFVPYSNEGKENLSHLCAAPPDSSIFVHALGGLSEMLLVGQDPFGFSDKENFARYFKKNVPDSGIVVSPSPKGAELFLWGVGRNDLSPNELWDLDIAQVQFDDVPLPPKVFRFDEIETLE